MPDNPVCSIVVPVYNSTDNLRELARTVDRVFHDTVHADYELIFVDDGSPNPKTWPTLRELAGEKSAVLAIRLTRNFGQIPATLCGLEASRGEAVVVMDDDLQHRPEDIPLLLSARDHDVAVARFGRRSHGALSRLTSRIKGFFDWVILGKPRHLQYSSFLMLKRTIIRGMLAVETSYPLLLPLILHCTRDVVNVDVQHEPRKRGRSGYSLRTRFRLFTNLLISNSSFVLSVIGFLGISIAFVTFGLFVFFLIRKLAVGIGVSGWTSLMVTVLGIGGVHLFSVGIIGTYLIRIIHTSERRPGYVVRCDTRQEEGGE